MPNFSTKMILTILLKALSLAMECVVMELTNSEFVLLKQQSALSVHWSKFKIAFVKDKI